MVVARTEPIRFLSMDGSVAASPREITCVPVMHLTFPSQRDGTYRGVWAMVDTGADRNSIAADFVGELDLTRVEIQGQRCFVTGVNGRTSSELYLANYYLTRSRAHVRDEFVTAPFTDDGNRRYSLILGRSFLTLGSLTMDFPKGIFEFRYTGQSDTKVDPGA